MDPALKKRLEAMLKHPDNQKCADCKKRGNFTKYFISYSTFSN